MFYCQIFNTLRLVVNHVAHKTAEDFWERLLDVIAEERFLDEVAGYES